MAELAMLAPLAVLIDALIGDPRSSLHPVVLIGKLISTLEKQLLSAADSKTTKRLKGFGLVIIVLGACYGTVWSVVKIARLGLPDEWSFFVELIVIAFTISPRALVQAGLDIRHELAKGDMVAARNKVGMIVGRDVQTLDESEVTRATVETMAENIVDGVISPLFFALLGGAPLAMLYRAVNTMDSMLGYRSVRYLDFGAAAARTDDVFNFIPARISGVLIILTALLLGFNAKRAAFAIWKDAAKHPSPNSGISEAGVAGALGVQLGGLNYYGGVASQRALMGKPIHQLGHRHILQTAWFVYGVTVLFCVFSGLAIMVGGGMD